MPEAGEVVFAAVSTAERPTAFLDGPGVPSTGAVPAVVSNDKCKELGLETHETSIKNGIRSPRPTLAAFPGMQSSQSLARNCPIEVLGYEAWPRHKRRNGPWDRFLFLCISYLVRGTNLITLNLLKSSP